MPPGVFIGPAIILFIFFRLSAKTIGKNTEIPEERRAKAVTEETAAKTADTEE